MSGHKHKEPTQKYRLGTISSIKLLAGLNRFSVVGLIVLCFGVEFCAV